MDVEKRLSRSWCMRAEGGRGKKKAGDSDSVSSKNKISC